MKKQFLKVTTLASVAILAGYAQLAQANEPAPSAEIAVIGDKTITQDDIYQALKGTYGKQVFRRLVILEVLEKNVPTAADVKAQLEADLEAQMVSVGGKEAFEQLLAAQRGVTLDEFKQQIYLSQLLKTLIESKLDTSDEALKAFYEKDYFAPLEAQHILVETEDEAKAVIERLNKGEDFAALAAELSKDTGSAQNGGLVQGSPTQPWVAEFDAAVRGQKNGETTQTPVKSQFGYHIIKTIKNGEKASFDESKEDVKTAYVAAKLADSELQNQILSDAVKAANIQMKDADFEEAIKDLLEYKAPEATSESAAPESAESASSKE